MVFSSIEFLFFFLPLFLAAQCFLSRHNLVYTLFSLLFYWIGEGWYCAIVIISVVVNFFFAKHINGESDEDRRKVILTLGIITNLLPLLYFKYTGFIYTSVLNLDGGHWISKIHLPLGISFFTFHAISYLVDVYRRDAPAENSLNNLALYMLMFPQLIAGPILRFHTIASQLHQRTVTVHHVYYGLALFSIGLGQKLLLADTLAGVCDPLFARWESLSTATAWLAASTYTLQIYFDFNGYSNMAIGLGWLTGFHFPQNFNYPYAARSITEFWQRWHMSLSRWFRDYLYIPLGGNRLGAWKTYRNLFVVFVLCGLWHGAAWTFLVWGIWHGSLLVIERHGLGRRLNNLPAIIQHTYTALAFVTGWVWFRADNIPQAIAILRKMFFLDQTIDVPALQLITTLEIVTLVAALFLSLPWLLRRARGYAALPEYGIPWQRRSIPTYLLGITALAPVFSFAVIKIFTSAYSPFIYFRF